jgi:hypothetical protein
MDHSIYATHKVVFHNLCSSSKDGRGDENVVVIMVMVVTAMAAMVTTIIMFNSPKGDHSLTSKKSISNSKL